MESRTGEKAMTLVTREASESEFREWQKSRRESLEAWEEEKIADGGVYFYEGMPD